MADERKCRRHFHAVDRPLAMTEVASLPMDLERK